MKPSCKLRKKNRQAGVALLIAIFAMLLIAAIAMALVVSSGTETSLAANYRATTKNSPQLNNKNTWLGATSNFTRLYLRSSLVPAAMLVPSVVGAAPAPPSIHSQSFEITALALTPNGSHKLLQYIVTAAQYNI